MSFYGKTIDAPDKAKLREFSLTLFSTVMRVKAHSVCFEQGGYVAFWKQDGDQWSLVWAGKPVEVMEAQDEN
ncbi:MAG: hypothetical protein ACTHJ9_00590 [Rhodanobacter sp.]